MENYKQKYEAALEQAKQELEACGSLDCDAARQVFRLFPELQSIKNEKIKTNIIKLLRFVRDTNHQYSDACNEAIDWLEKHGEKFIPEDINEAALQYVDTCTIDGEITHDNVTEPYWNNHSMMNAYKAGWLEKQGKQNHVEETKQAKKYIK